MKSLLLPLFLAGALAASGQTILLDDFNTGTVSGATIGGTSWLSQTTQNATTLTVGGTAKDDNGWGDTFSALNLSAMTTINITAQRDAGNVAPTFSVQFLDSGLQSQTFTVSTASFLVGSMSTVTINIGGWGSVNPTDITEWNIGGGGVGTNAFRMTLDNLSVSAVPEPSTYAALAGLIGLGAAMLRRRSTRRAT